MMTTQLSVKKLLNIHELLASAYDALDADPENPDLDAEVERLNQKLLRALVREEKRYEVEEAEERAKPLSFEQAFSMVPKRDEKGHFLKMDRRAELAKDLMAAETES